MIDSTLVMDPDAAFSFVRRLAAPLLGLLLWMPVGAPADTVPYRHFTAGDGLPHETIVSLDQGPDRRLWIGTAGGLTVYDGHTIRRVSLPDSMGNPRVLDILARSSDQTWVILKGIGLVRLRQGRVKQVVRKPPGTNGFVRLLSRRDTVLAVMRKSLRTFSAEGKRLTKRHYDYLIQTGAPETVDPSMGLGVTDATLGPNGTIWVLDRRHGLGRVSLDGSVSFLNASSSTSSGTHWTSARLAGAQTALVTGDNGTYRVNLSSGRRSSLSTRTFSQLRLLETGFVGIHQERVVYRTPTRRVSYGPKLGLPRTLYKTAFEDASGDLWIGTGDGLLFLPSPEARHVKQIDGTTLRWAGDFKIDSTRNELWIASWGLGLFRLRPTRAHRVPGTSPKWTMDVDGRDGSLHALSRDGWFRRASNGWSLVNASLSSTGGIVRPTGNGYFWTGDGLVRLRPDRSAVPDTLWHWPREKRGFHTFALAPDGDVLLRSYGTVLRFPPEAPHRADTLATFPNLRSEGTGSMVVHDQALWVTFSGQGLLRIGLQPSNPTVNWVLSDTAVWHLSPAGDSLLFAGTENGLCLLNTRFRRVQRCLTAADGLVSTGSYAATFYQDTLYVSHGDGLSKLPRTVINQPPSPPRALLTNWSVNDSSRSLADSTRLASSERTVSFDFTGVQLARGADVRYAYRLVPRDTSWTQTRKAFTRYTDLPPGTYRFEIRSRLENGPGGSTAQLTFTIPKAYYETAWFKGLSVFGFFLLLSGAFVWRTRALRRRQERLQQMVDERTAQLADEKQKTEEQARRLETLDEQKNRFFANVSHELRTPLTILQGTSQDLLDGAFGEIPTPAQRRVEIMRRNVDRLRRLTDQLLDLSRLETAGPEIDVEPKDLVALLRHTVRSFVPLAERRGLDLNLDTTVDEHPCRVDPEKMEKIVGNLLSNALQNTPEGGTVQVRLDIEDGDPPETVLRVVDTGRGIAPERQDEIFERFAHAGRENGDREGTGIGLSLVHEYVKMHDGSIDLDSTPGEGTTFTVRLPLPPADMDAIHSDVSPNTDDPVPTVPNDGPTPSPGDGTAADGDRPVVLVVEDNADVRAYLRRHLAGTYQIVEATSGTQALEEARETAPDLVLTDVMMPEMDGIELCQNLRADDDLARTPVILLTARAAEHDAVAGLEAGADAYVTKPFSMAELQARLRRLLEAHWTGAADTPTHGRLAPDVKVTSADEEFLTRVTDAIDDNLSRTGFTVEDLAAEVGLSPRQLQRKLKRLTDTTPAAFIRRYRLDAAAQLLEKEAGTVSEVAYEVGFGTLETFTTRFEEQFGCSPSAYPDDAPVSPSN